MTCSKSVHTDISVDTRLFCNITNLFSSDLRVTYISLISNLLVHCGLFAKVKITFFVVTSLTDKLDHVTHLVY